MAIPAGVTTATVTAGVAVSFSGTQLRSYVTIEPSAFLVHTETGTPLVNMLEDQNTAVGVAGQFILPHTDQDGFQDENGNAYKNWYYTATIQYQSDRTTLPAKTKIFQLVAGQTLVDLDRLPGGQAAMPYSAPILQVSSVNGQTGAVTVPYVEPAEIDAKIAAAGEDKLAKDDLGTLLASAREPVAILSTGAEGARITNSSTGARVAIAGKVTEPAQYGAGVKARVDGEEQWISPSGYPRPLKTSFLRASLWGSSSAANMGPELTTALQALGMELHYTTGAVGSYQITHTAAAMGIRPLSVDAFSIPASGGVTVTPNNMPEANNTAVPVSWPGSFAGIPGVLSKGAGSAVWTFTRDFAGTVTVVSAGTAFKPSKAYEVQDGVALLNMGKNTLTDNTAMSYTDVVNLTERAYDFFAGAGRHVLVIGHYQAKPWIPGTGGFERIEAYNRWAKERYGSRFVDVQAYLSSAKVWTDTGISPTAEDLEAQVYPQYISPSLALDSMHLNNVGDLAVANLIAAKLVELGWTQSYAFTLPGVPTPAVAWTADTIQSPDGSPVTRWTAIGGNAALVNATEAKAVMATSGTNRYIAKERADGPFTLSAFGQYKTVITLCRVRNFADLTLLVNMGAMTLYRSAAGNLVASAGSNITTPMPVDTWGVAAGVYDGASSRVSWDTTVVTGNAGTSAATAFMLSRVNDFADIDYSAVLCFTEVLTPVQVQTVVTALKAAKAAGDVVQGDILTSLNGTKYRLTVDNEGILTTLPAL